jgi:hypothetical protein
MPFVDRETAELIAEGQREGEVPCELILGMEDQISAPELFKENDCVWEVTLFNDMEDESYEEWLEQVESCQGVDSLE